MLAALLAATTALALDTAAGQSAAPRSLVGRDSTRVLKAARKAQSDFEGLRRRLLPSQTGLTGRACDVVIGRYCHWQGSGNGPPPEEPKVIAKREWLIITLDSLGRSLPGDRWILAQRVRYRMEAGRIDEAERVAISCANRATVSSVRGWCLALAGYAAQELGQYAYADSAFAGALAALPEKERCRWQDISLILDRKTAGRFKRLGCAARDTMALAVWRVVQPLYLTGVNDLRTEYLARVTRMYVEKDARTPMSAYQGADDREALLRFGGGMWYTQEIVRSGSTQSTVVASHRRGPVFDFFPYEGVLATLERLRPTDWSFDGLLPQFGYAPGYAQNFRPLDNQVAVFRRSDSAVVVGAFDVGDDPEFTDGMQAGFFAAPLEHGGVGAPLGGPIAKPGRFNVSTLSAPWRPLLVSLEVLDREHRSAGRARFTVTLPPSGTRLSLSDLLLYAPRDSAPTQLGEAAQRALPTLRVTRNRQLGLFWETYGARPQGEAFAYSLLVTPIGESWVKRAFDKLRRREKSFLSISWKEVPSVADGVAPRALDVNLALLRPGRYRMQLALTAAGEAPVITTREIELADD